MSVPKLSPQAQLALRLGTAALGAAMVGAGWLAEKRADAIEEAAEAKRALAVAKLSNAQRELATSMERITQTVRLVYDELAQAARPVMEFYSITIETAETFPLPPGFEDVLSTAVNPLPPRARGFAWDNVLGPGTAGQQQFLNFNFMMARAASGKFGGLASHAQGLMLTGLGAAQAEGGLAQLQSARKMAVEVRKMEVEVDSWVAHLSEIKRLAQSNGQTFTDMRPFVDRWLPPALVLYEARRPRTGLTADEWLQIQHLTAMFAAANKLAQKPLA